MPGYYLYIPIERNKVPYSKINQDNNWQKHEKENGREVVVTYYGSKALKNVPNYAKIYLSMHGTNTLPNKLFKEVATRTIAQMQDERSKAFLEISDGENWIRIDETAKRMVDDGLFDNDNTHVRIKLFYCDEGDKAKRLAEFFLEILREYDEKKTQAHNKETGETRQPGSSNRFIRIDYYAGYILWTPYRAEGSLNYHKYAEKESFYAAKHPRASQVRCSLFNKETAPQPSLTRVVVEKALEQFYQTGILGRFGFGQYWVNSHNQQIIDALKKASTDQKRFAIANAYTSNSYNAEDNLALCLKPFVDEALLNDKRCWHGHLQEVSNQSTSLVR